MKTKEENIYYDYDTKKCATKATIEKAIDEDLIFKYTNNSKNYEDFYRVLDVEVQDDGETILLTFYE